ncbi:trafficking kinesin-binding protein 1-like protein [Willisornis vidua]|uniref:Trafficking kinesin-binding protein 1-like protein n=1 Tax=Willisornis vidua TaxID=1566151 RepID=A0ABQ9DH28_9PASS|nr:trafficking kinesin-binding protein 1-like protein [Willisornis vidua]
MVELSSGDVPEVEIISLLAEQLPHYTLRADTVFGYDHGDWLQAPLGPPEPAAPLTPQQIEETLQYFRECLRAGEGGGAGKGSGAHAVGAVWGRDGEGSPGANHQ